MSHYQGRVKTRSSADGIDIVSEFGSEFIATVCIGEAERAKEDAQRIVLSWNFLFQWEQEAKL